MEFSIKTGVPEKQKSACVVVGVFEDGTLDAAASRLDKASGKRLGQLIERGDLSGKAGSSLVLHDLPGTVCARVLLVGLGKRDDFGDKAYAAALRNALKALAQTGAEDAVVYLTTLAVGERSPAWKVRQALIAAGDASYRFDQFKSSPADERALTHLAFAVAKDGEQKAAETALTQGLAIAEGCALARDLGNLPGNVCTPEYLARTARELADEFGLELEVLEREDMEQLGMHSLLSVAKGSRQAPKLIVAHYRGAPAKKGSKKSKGPLVLVGKGITFDSGGISLKPGEGMDEMKFDMCGAASVLGTLKTVAQLALPIDLTVIVPATENMPDGAASKPGDIVASLSGQSIEILNTDAEGRLILCDALTYAERFEPAAVIDVATLTGACVVALGHVATGLFTNDDELAADLLAAGGTALDRAWQLPLWDDYQDLLKSNFADMANIGGRWGGSITAACFLSRFARKYTWAHLDIAGTAWKSGADKGATGRPVPLLAHYLIDRAGKLA
ncbi:MAG: leucyl aminopeptidase [Propionivibrio sp.]